MIYFFLLLPTMLFLWSKSSTGESQHGSLFGCLQQGQFPPSVNQAGCISDLCLAMIRSRVIPCSPQLSQLALLHFPIGKPLRSISIQILAHIFPIFLGPWPDSSFSLLLPLLCFFLLLWLLHHIQLPSPTLMQLFFPYVLQCNSWGTGGKCDALLTALLPARQPCDASNLSESVP